MDYRTRSFLALDGLRGAAALAVLIYHSPKHTYGLPSAYLAVDLFFALSGFVLAYAYEQALRQGLSPRRFILLRWIRLFPLFALGLFLGALSALVSRPETISAQLLVMQLVIGLQFLPFPWGGDVAKQALFPLNIPAWSLFMEMLVNIAFAFMAPHLSNRRLVAIIAAAAIWVGISALISGDLAGGWGFGTIADGVGRVFFSFFVGVALYRLHEAKVVEFVSLPFWVSISVTTILFAIPASGFRPFFDVAVVLIAFPVIILAAARDRPRLVFTPFLMALGLYSYAIYIIQEPVLRLVMAFFDRQFYVGFIQKGAVGAIVLIAAVLACAFVATRYYEPATRSLLNRLLIKRDDAKTAERRGKG